MNQNTLNSLDLFDEYYEARSRMVVLSYYFLDSQVHLHAAQLREYGIQCFISNSISSYLLPIASGGFGLYVRRTDLESAIQVIKDLEENKASSVFNFKDADIEDIRYEQELNDGPSVFSKLCMSFVIFFLIAILIGPSLEWIKLF